MPHSGLLVRTATVSARLVLLDGRVAGLASKSAGEQAGQNTDNQMTQVMRRNRVTVITKGIITMSDEMTTFRAWILGEKKERLNSLCLRPNYMTLASVVIS